MLNDYTSGFENSIDHILNPKNCHPQKDRKLVFKTNYSLNAGHKYCRMERSILQYFRLSLSYHLSLRSLVSLFLNGRFTQLLLHIKYTAWKGYT